MDLLGLSKPAFDLSVKGFVGRRATRKECQIT